MPRSRWVTLCTSISSSPDRTTRSISSSRPRDRGRRLRASRRCRVCLDPVTRTALLRYVAKNPPVREEALPAASAVPPASRRCPCRARCRGSRPATHGHRRHDRAVRRHRGCPAHLGRIPHRHGVRSVRSDREHLCLGPERQLQLGGHRRPDDSGSFTLPVRRLTTASSTATSAVGASERLMTGWWSPNGVVNANDAVRATVADGETLPGFDVTLQPGGWFTVMLQDVVGSPLDGICINPVSVATGNWERWPMVAGTGWRRRLGGDRRTPLRAVPDPLQRLFRTTGADRGGLPRT